MRFVALFLVLFMANITFAQAENPPPGKYHCLGRFEGHITPVWIFIKSYETGRNGSAFRAGGKVNCNTAIEYSGNLDGDNYFYWYRLHSVDLRKMLENGNTFPGAASERHCNNHGTHNILKVNEDGTINMRVISKDKEIMSCTLKPASQD